MDFFSNYPKAEKNFFGWMLQKYGATEDIFLSAPSKEKEKALYQFLGLPLYVSPLWNQLEIDNYILDKLYIYESSVIDYLIKFIDPIKEMKNMDNKKLEQVFHAETIKDCIIPIDKSNYSLSLKDCITKLTRQTKPIPVSDFWEEAIKQIHKNENVPF